MAIIKTKWNKISWILCAAFLVCAVVIGTTGACGPSEKDTSKMEAGKKDAVEFEGIVKVAVGKYVFIPEAGGFDIVVQGSLETEDTSALEGEQVRGEGTVNEENPSVLIADTLEIQDGAGNWRNIFTRTDDVVLDDYVSLDQREEFSFLEGLAYDKKDVWEGKEKAKIYGEYSEGEERKKVTVYSQEGNEEIGSVIVDHISDFALFYMKKLRLFDKFYIYIEIKDTVDWSIRRRTREMFHADIVFIGLF